MDAVAGLAILLLLLSLAAVLGATLHATFATGRRAFLLLALAVLWPLVFPLVTLAVVRSGEGWDIAQRLGEVLRLSVVATALALLYRLRVVR